MLVGEAFHGSLTPRHVVEVWSHEYSTHSEPAIRTWAERAATLLANPGRFEYEFWFRMGHTSSQQPLAGEAEAKAIDTIEDFILTIYSIDREGYIALYADLEEVEFLEWIDVMDGEYIVIDDSGYLYEPIESSDGFYDGWQKTMKFDTNLLEIIQHYNDGDQMVIEDLQRVRSDYILPRTKPWWKFW